MQGIGGGHRNGAFLSLAKKMNIKSILQYSISRLQQAGIPTPELDATILVSFALKKDKGFLLTHPEYKLKIWPIFEINKLVNRRKKYEPIAYIIGKKEFFGHDFLVDKNTLIPRPETEFLVEAAVDTFGSLKTVLDLGTGSGCIIISLIKALPSDYVQSSRFYATDVSAQALKIAKTNAKTHGIENKITFLQSDLLQDEKLPEKFDLILANLPYVPVDGAERGTEFEPRNAIFAEDNGTAVIKKFLSQAQNRLNKNGLILIELDPRNANEITQFAKNIFPTAKIELEKDLAQKDRYLRITIKD